jgi:recombination protein RecA
VRAKIVKNKVAPPFREAEFDIEYGIGISAEGCLLDLGLEHGLIQKSGSFFSYESERLGQGRNNAKAFLREHPHLMEEVEGKVYDALGLKRAAAPVGSALEDLLPDGQSESGPAAQDALSQERAA